MHFQEIFRKCNIGTLSRFSDEPGMLGSQLSASLRARKQSGHNSCTTSADGADSGTQYG
ncbi:hypothetical protein ACWCV5_35815 [Streptomyces tubercidicus]